MLCRVLSLLKAAQGRQVGLQGCLWRWILISVLILRLITIISHMLKHGLLAGHEVCSLLLLVIGVHYFHHILLVRIELLFSLLLRLLLDELLLLLLLTM